MVRRVIPFSICRPFLGSLPGPLLRPDLTLASPQKCAPTLPNRRMDGAEKKRCESYDFLAHSRRRRIGGIERCFLSREALGAQIFRCLGLDIGSQSDVVRRRTIPLVGWRARCSWSSVSAVLPLLTWLPRDPPHDQAPHFPYNEPEDEDSVDGGVLGVEEVEQKHDAEDQNKERYNERSDLEVLQLRRDRRPIDVDNVDPVCSWNVVAIHSERSHRRQVELAHELVDIRRQSSWK